MTESDSDIQITLRQNICGNIEMMNGSEGHRTMAAGHRDGARPLQWLTTQAEARSGHLRQTKPVSACPKKSGMVTPCV